MSNFSILLTMQIYVKCKTIKKVQQSMLHFFAEEFLFNLYLNFTIPKNNCLKKYGRCRNLKDVIFLQSKRKIVTKKMISLSEISFASRFFTNPTPLCSCYLIKQKFSDSKHLIHFKDVLGASLYLILRETVSIYSTNTISKSRIFFLNLLDQASYQKINILLGFLMQ
ncbi:hypothetical protein BpHYR1_008432 [Brachionus plicatilis]|uniref:Uncharacterized protein n=1 Tax=Brachionus plicatilis TaxID=10195 RepID=A0A3M7SBW9_BRAPC|nr:hypothetical protein BpHYR1_008432 [Brachionus plicatilis]